MMYDDVDNIGGKFINYKLQLNMNLNILQQIGLKPFEQKKPEDQQQDVECVDSKIWLWDGDSYEQFQSDYLNQIFPYKLNKKTMNSNAQFIFHFLSSSLHYWVELVQEGEVEPEKMGKKDIKVIDQILKLDESQNHIAFHRWGEQFNKRQQFLKHQEEQQSYASPVGEVIHQYTRGEDDFTIIKYLGSDKSFLQFKRRLQVLFLFYIDGVSFVFQEIDTWIYYVIYKQNKSKKGNHKVVGVLSKYVFRLSSIRQRHRISQVFILPPYQKSGHGKQLIDVIYNISLADPKCFEITTEIPSFEYQCLRDYKQMQMLITSNILALERMKKVVNTTQILQNRSILLQKDNVRLIKQKLKMPGHQIERLVNMLIYYRILQSQNGDMPRAYFQQQIRQSIIINRSPFKTRKFLPHITFYGKVPNLKDFMVEKAKEDLLRNQDEVQEILTETLKGFMRVISKLKKNKLIL